MPEPVLCTCSALRRATRHVTAYYDQALAPLGLRITQFSILAVMRARGPGTITELAAALAMDRTTLGRNLRPLERDGLVSLGPDSADRRRTLLSLSPAGAALLETAGPAWRAAQQGFRTAFGEGATQRLRQTLAQVTATPLGPPGPPENADVRS